MKRFVKIGLVLVILVGALSVVTMKTTASHNVCDWQLTFSDHFTTSSLDTKKWNIKYPSGNGGEQQYYAPDAFTLQNSILKITAEKRAMQGYPFTSGIITTQGTFSQKYGFFSIRAKLPKGQGFWPAFWMLPAQPNYPTEIDVFEMLGGKPDTIYMSNHWRDANQDHQKNVIPYKGPDFSSDFHTFGLLWSPTELIWYVDGVEQYRTRDGVPNVPMFLLVNFAVGGKWPGNPDQTTSFPSSMEIDYVHTYEYQCHPGYSSVVDRLELLIHEYVFGTTPPS